VLDARVVAVAAGNADALHQHDAAAVGGVDRRALRRGDVDARVDVAGELLAEGVRDRTVEAASSCCRCRARSAGHRIPPLRGVELAGDLARRRLELVDVVLQVRAVGAHLVQRGGLAGLRARVADAHPNGVQLDRGDLVAAPLDDLLAFAWRDSSPLGRRSPRVASAFAVATPTTIQRSWAKTAR
jgi:hypothetical protein